MDITVQISPAEINKSLTPIIMSTLEEHEFIFGTQKKTFYLAAGPQDGPLLVFIHGWPTIAKTWQHQLKAFALLGFRVVAPDMPGKFDGSLLL